MYKSARKIVQTSELSKEILIQAPREKDSEKQMEILELASDGKETVRQIRKDQKSGGTILAGGKSGPHKTSESKAKSINNAPRNDTFNEWCWGPKSGNYEVIIRFADSQSCDRKLVLIQGALKEAYENFTNSETQVKT